MSGGGDKPASGVPARRYSWPPFETGNEVSKRHGFFASPTLREEDRAELEDIERLLWSVIPAATERDGPTIAACAELVWRLRRGYADLHEHGLLRDGTPAAVLRHIETAERTFLRFAVQLGLTPRSRAELGLDLVQAKGAAAAAYLTEKRAHEADERRSGS